jgi:Fe-S-cluster-containing dehydrogenase component
VQRDLQRAAANAEAVTADRAALGRYKLAMRDDFDGCDLEIVAFVGLNGWADDGSQSDVDCVLQKDPREILRYDGQLVPLQTRHCLLARRLPVSSPTRETESTDMATVVYKVGDDISTDFIYPGRYMKRFSRDAESAGVLLKSLKNRPSNWRRLRPVRFGRPPSVGEESLRICDSMRSAETHASKKRQPFRKNRLPHFRAKDDCWDMNKHRCGPAQASIPMSNCDNKNAADKGEGQSCGGLSRRNFMRSVTMAAGAAVAGIAVVEKASAAATKPVSCGKTVAAMTVGGKIIQVAEADVMAGAQTPMPVTGSAARIGVPGKKWIMVIDLAKCDGCGKCTEGCNKMHFIPQGRRWIKVLRMKDSEETAPYFFPQPCFHCDNPPCTKVCPVDATFKRQDGIVLIDNDRCIGCRFCMAACPYGARSFNWAPPEDPLEATSRTYSPEQGYPRRIGTVEKCDFCPDMAMQGKLPACASACPMGVIYFGDENEDAVTNGIGETVRLSKMLKDGAAYRFMEDLGTKPRVYCLPPRSRKFPGPEVKTS